MGGNVIAVFRNGELIKINERNSSAQSAARYRYLSKTIPNDELAVDPMNKGLPNHWAQESVINIKSINDIEIGSEPIELEKNDKVILFSDGVYNSLNEVELARILASYLAPNDAAQEIIESINQKKLENQDNATIVILQNFR